MKYLLIGITVVISLTACKKEWKCSCTESETLNGVDMYPPNTDEWILLDVSKKDAQRSCLGYEVIFTDPSYEYIEKSECILTVNK